MLSNKRSDWFSPGSSKQGTDRPVLRVRSNDETGISNERSYINRIQSYENSGGLRTGESTTKFNSLKIRSPRRIMGEVNRAESNVSRFQRKMHTRSSSVNLNQHKSPPLIRKIGDVAHFHYDTIELGPLHVRFEEVQFPSNPGAASSDPEGPTVSGCDLQVPHPGKDPNFPLSFRVTSNDVSWTISRSYKEIVAFDRQLHRCVYDRRISRLLELPKFSPEHEDIISMSLEEIFEMVDKYFQRFSDLAGSLITCFPVLKWLELDNRGFHLMTAEETPINTPALAAAYVVRAYSANAPDELSLRVGDIVSVIDMPAPAESVWWKGKLTISTKSKGLVESKHRSRSEVQIAGRNKVPGNEGQEDILTELPKPTSSKFEVGFFPSYAVQLFGATMQGVPAVLQGSSDSLDHVGDRRGKLMAFLRTFVSNRPSRRRLKETGILKERVFGCDLAEHVQNTGQDVPLVLKSCATTIEDHGLVDGIYRLSGVMSNIQRLRNAFDENREPNLTEASVLQDVHAVASLLKMYFRDLPNPLFTFQLYSQFMEAVEGKKDRQRIISKLHKVVQTLPPPHYRTAEYLMKHLKRVSEKGSETGMASQNLAIVWAPNLFRSRNFELNRENAGAALQSVNTQAVITDYLIRHSNLIFSHRHPSEKTQSAVMLREPSLSGSASKGRGRPRSIRMGSVEQAPVSPVLESSPSKLMGLDEAQQKIMASRSHKIPPGTGLPDLTNRKCIDVNGGPVNLPEKYHTVINIPTRSEKKGSTIQAMRSVFGLGGDGNNTPPIRPLTPYAKIMKSKAKTVERENSVKPTDTMYSSMQKLHVKNWDVRRQNSHKRKNPSLDPPQKALNFSTDISQDSTSSWKSQPELREEITTSGTHLSSKPSGIHRQGSTVSFSTFGRHDSPLLGAESESSAAMLSQSLHSEISLVSTGNEDAKNITNARKRSPPPPTIPPPPIDYRSPTAMEFERTISTAFDPKKLDRGEVEENEYAEINDIDLDESREDDGREVFRREGPGRQPNYFSVRRDKKEGPYLETNIDEAIARAKQKEEEGRPQDPTVTDETKEGGSSSEEENINLGELTAPIWKHNNPGWWESVFDKGESSPESMKTAVDDMMEEIRSVSQEPNVDTGEVRWRPKKKFPIEEIDDETGITGALESGSATKLSSLKSQYCDSSASLSDASRYRRSTSPPAKLGIRPQLALLAEELENAKKLVAGRVLVHTPAKGLSQGYSAPHLLSSPPSVRSPRVGFSQRFREASMELYPSSPPERSESAASNTPGISRETGRPFSAQPLNFEDRERERQLLRELEATGSEEDVSSPIPADFEKSDLSLNFICDSAHRESSSTISPRSPSSRSQPKLAMSPPTTPTSFVERDVTPRNFEDMAHQLEINQDEDETNLDRPCSPGVSLINTPDHRGPIVLKQEVEAQGDIYIEATVPLRPQSFLDQKKSPLARPKDRSHSSSYTSAVTELGIPSSSDSGSYSSATPTQTISIREPAPSNIRDVEETISPNHQRDRKDRRKSVYDNVADSKDNQEAEVKIFHAWNPRQDQETAPPKTSAPYFSTITLSESISKAMNSPTESLDNKNTPFERQTSLPAKSSTASSMTTSLLYEPTAEPRSEVGNFKSLNRKQERRGDQHTPLQRNKSELESCWLFRRQADISEAKSSLPCGTSVHKLFRDEDVGGVSLVEPGELQYEWRRSKSEPPEGSDDEIQGDDESRGIESAPIPLPRSAIPIYHV